MRGTVKRIVVGKPLSLGVLWTLTIFILCAAPGEYIPSKTWLDLLSIDKWIHALMFFILCILFFAAAVKYSKGMWVFVLIVVCGVLYGGLLEVMQATCFSNRGADWQDFAADAAGCLLALPLIKKIRSAFEAH